MPSIVWITSPLLVGLMTSLPFSFRNENSGALLFEIPNVSGPVDTVRPLWVLIIFTGVFGIAFFPVLLTVRWVLPDAGRLSCVSSSAQRIEPSSQGASFMNWAG